MNSLEGIVVDSINHRFVISARPNDAYEGSAYIYYALNDKINISALITSKEVYLDDKFEDEDLTKANILNSIQTQNPGVNINQLNVN
jgi:hypothetical protein